MSSFYNFQGQAFVSVARYFGTVKKTGVTRYYRSFAKAVKKAPVRQRAYRQIGAGTASYAYQRWGW